MNSTKVSKIGFSILGTMAAFFFLLGCQEGNTIAIIMWGALMLVEAFNYDKICKREASGGIEEDE